jgi:mono/diheme cytochrome c family protein
MRSHSLVALILILAICAFATFAQQPVVKHVPIPPTSVDGQDMYAAYCVSCHGTSAKGTGGAAPAMSTVVPDLTTIAQRHGGDYPTLYVQSAIRGDTNARPSEQTMPHWGVLLGSVSKYDRAKVDLRIHNLADYLETLQVQQQGD